MPLKNVLICDRCNWEEEANEAWKAGDWVVIVPHRALPSNELESDWSRYLCYDCAATILGNLAGK